MKVSKKAPMFSDQNGMILCLINMVSLIKMFSTKKETYLSNGLLLMITRMELRQLLVVLNKPL